MFHISFLSHRFSIPFLILTTLAGITSEKHAFSGEPERSETAAVSKNAEYVRVSTENPSYLELSDGTPYIPVGVNLCILRDKDENGKTVLLSDEKSLEKIEFYFQKLSENGGTYARIWLGMPVFDIESDFPGHFDAKKIENVRNLLDLAQKYGIRLKLCLEHFRNLSDSPVWENGSITFSKRIYATNPPKNMQEFTQGDVGRGYYLARTHKYIELFGTHPAVFGWELWNEVNCLPNCTPWTEFMLERVTAMNPKQMVFQSLGSFDSESQARLYPQHAALKQNVLIQIHRYYDPGAKLPVCQAPMDVLAADCVRTARTWNVQKPVLATELGAVKPSHTGPSNLYDADTEGVLLHDILFAPFFSGSAGSGHCWHWNVYIEKHDLWFQIGRFSEAIKNINPVAERFEPFYEEQNSLRIYGLRGRHTTLVWLRDSLSDSRSELVEGKPAQMRKNLSVILPENIPSFKTADFYDPWKNTHAQLSAKSRTVTIPALKRSGVLRITY